MQLDISAFYYFEYRRGFFIVNVPIVFDLIDSLTPLLVKGINKSVRRIIKSIVLIGLALVITIFLISGIAFWREGLTLDQILQAVDLPWLKTAAIPGRLTLGEYAGQFPLTNLAGLETNDQTPSLADVYGTLVKIDQNKSLAVVIPRTPDYIYIVPESGEKADQGRIVILLDRDTKIIDPFAEKTRNYQEMVSSRDGHLGRFIGSYVHIAVGSDTEGKLVAKEMAIAGVSR